MFRASTRLVNPSGKLNSSPLYRSFTQQPIKRTSNIMSKQNNTSSLVLTPKRSLNTSQRASYQYQSGQQATGNPIGYVVGGAAVLGLVGLAASGMTGESTLG